MLLNPYYISEVGQDPRDFEGLPLSVLKELIDGGFVDLLEWNNCPGVTSLFLPYLESHPSYRAHGYSNSPGFRDGLITIEGIETDRKLTPDEIIEFVYAFAGAETLCFYEGFGKCRYD